MVTVTTRVSHCDRCGALLDDESSWFGLTAHFGEERVEFPWCDITNGTSIIDLCGKCEAEFGRWIVEPKVSEAIAKARRILSDKPMDLSKRW